MGEQVSEVFWCTNCLNMSTRPRVSFDARGWCNACQWMEEKQALNWDDRKRELYELLARHKSTGGHFDCVTTVSGGKDGSYVSYNVQHIYGMNPVAITVTPALPLELGNRNLKNFINSGYNHLQVNADPQAMRILNREGFILTGFPYFGWLMAMQAAPIRMAANLGISLIFYGEDGEVEYGGSTALKNKATYDIDFMRKIYLEGGQDRVLKASGLPVEKLYFFMFPTEKELAGRQLEIAHWSYFESWDPYRNYLVAKEHCGLEEADASNSGTFTNFAQNDQALYALHTYVMYLKFGFGRATQDVGIEVRRGAMSREQGVQLVRLYDGHYPEEYIELYLDYYGMTRDEFDAALDHWANTDLFEKKSGRWVPTFEVK